MTEGPLSICARLPDPPSLCPLPLCSLNQRFGSVPACIRARRPGCLLFSHSSVCFLLSAWLFTDLPFFPIGQNGFSLIVQGSFLQPMFVTLAYLLYRSSPLLLISGAIYTETFLLTLRTASHLLQSSSLSLFLFLSFILLLFYLTMKNRQVRKNCPILNEDIHREAQHLKFS